jgi:hypothetical protein
MKAADGEVYVRWKRRNFTVLLCDSAAGNQTCTKPEKKVPEGSSFHVQENTRVAITDFLNG